MVSPEGDRWLPINNPSTTAPGNRAQCCKAVSSEKTSGLMAGIAINLSGFAVLIGGYHFYLLRRIPAKTTVSDFVDKLKANTSKHINETSNAAMKFSPC